MTDPRTFSVTDWPSRNDGAPVLQFMPHPAKDCLLAATIDEQPAGVRITTAQAAFLAVELTRAVGLQPRIELENLARSSAPDAPAEVTAQEPAPDPRDALLRRAMMALWSTPTLLGIGAENVRLRLGVEIAAHLLDLPLPREAA